MTRSAGAVLALFVLTAPAAARAQPWAYVGSLGEPVISVIDTAADQVVATLPAALGPTAVSDDGRRAYLADAEHWQLRVLDTASATFLHTIELESRATGLVVSPDGARVYVAIQDRTVWAIDPERGEVVGAIGTGPEPNAMVIAPAGTRLFVADDFGRGVTVVDTASLRVVQRIALSPRPYVYPGNTQALALDPTGARLYAGEYFGRTLTVVDLATYAVVDQIEVGPSPIALAVSPDGGRVYVALATSDVAVVDLASRTVEHIRVNAQPGPLALTPDGSRLYVVAGTRVVAIDTATRAPVASILVAARPWAFAGFLTGAPRNPICPGDRDGDGVVSVAEIVTGVARALGGCPAPPLRCDGDLDADGAVDIAELTRAVGAALTDCPAPPSPPPTPTPDPAATPTTPRCIGDCNGDQVVSVDELALAGAIATGAVPGERCVAQSPPSPYEADGYAFGPCTVPLTDPDATAASRLVVTTTAGPVGAVATVSVALRTGGATIAGVQATLIAPPDLPLQDCAADPAAGTRVLVGLLPHACARSTDCLRARILALWPDAPAPIADGTVLLTCTIAIPAAAAPGDYPVALRGLRATDPLGTALPLGAATGTLTVVPGDPPAGR